MNSSSKLFATKPLTPLPATRSGEKAAYSGGKSEIQVLFCADEAYAPHLAAAIASIVSNLAHGDRVRFHVLSNGFPQAVARDLSSVAETASSSIRFLHPRKDLERFVEAVSVDSPYHKLPKLGYYRLMMGSLFPDLHRILYLDCDMIVLESLAPLWNTPLGGMTLGAVEDQGRGKALEHDKAILGVGRYLNSGLLLVDLDAWRARDTEARLRLFGETRRDIPRLWHDQTMLNAVLKDEVLFLEPRWNRMVDCLLEGVPPETLEKKPAVVHFTGGSKPWTYNSTPAPFSERYWQYRKMTPWGSELSLRPIVARFRREKARMAWRHPRDFALSLLGLSAPWAPAAPLGGSAPGGMETMMRTMAREGEPTQNPHFPEKKRSSRADAASDSIHLFLVSDDAYAPHLGTLIQSVAESAKGEDRFVFHVMTCGITPRNLKGLQEIAERGGHGAAFLEPDRALMNLVRKVAAPYPYDNFPEMTYYRLGMGSLFPGLDRLIYLDSDMIVLKSLRPLWETQLGGKTAAAVEDQGVSELIESERKNLGVDRYLNAGMLLVDLEAWRCRKTEERFARFAAERTDVVRRCHDQSLLNVVLKDEILFLGKEWNLMVHDAAEAADRGPVDSELARAMEDPAIVHFTCSKPWNYHSRAIPFTDRYWTFRESTPWGGNELNQIRKKLRWEKLRHAWRHPRDFALSLLGFSAPWAPAVPKGLEAKTR